jgi:hypothetical protein
LLLLLLLMMMMLCLLQQRLLHLLQRHLLWGRLLELWVLCVQPLSSEPCLQLGTCTLQ